VVPDANKPPSGGGHHHKSGGLFRCHDLASRQHHSHTHDLRDSTPGHCVRRTLWAVPDPATAVLKWLMAPGTGSEEFPNIRDLFVRPAWMKQAACVGKPVELFFPRRGASATVARVRELCAGCPVREDAWNTPTRPSTRWVCGVG
jgi:hypothetical protein